MSLREKKKEETKTRLLAAARSAFAERGYAAAKTSDVAKAVGIAEGTLFNYFPTKAELFLAAMLPPPSELPETPASPPGQDPAGWAAAAAAIVDANLRGLAEMEKPLQREFMSLFYGGRPKEIAGLTAFDRRLADRIGAFFAKRKEALPAELRTFDAALATECVCGLTLAAYSVFLMDDARSYPEMLNELRRQFEFVLSGHVPDGR
ncbi:TetR/AcrR family transcriptional regulator [Paenibacillus antri]|uniref:TetR/AcrR family transcriptional regulator n=1 Tax=Paenibacillus antri TaxID=2582848 RepID=A0A5R9GKX2_9BACL|nr:TetR/AcrR family transcriptional regulator [Paenibacillus antri]TLS54188.1 TetR/AcrR family transcriptional regulator [Paenibacillus antri]